MLFEYTSHRGKRSPVTDAATFQVAAMRLSGAPTSQTDVSNLIDRSYEYHSQRELRWHLAERLGLAPAAVGLREAA